MPRALKIPAWILGGVLLLIALLILALLIIGNTESGRAYVSRVTAHLTHGHVRIIGIHGSFPAALDLDRLELSDARGVWLFAEHISLRWRPAALLTRRISVDLLHVARLHMERAPLPSPDTKPSSTPSIPHSDLRDLSIDTLELGPELAGSAASLVVHGSAHLRSLQDATARIIAQRSGGVGDYELQLRFDPARMDATLKLQEPAHGPLENILKTPGLGDLLVQASVHGPRSAEQIQLTLDAGTLHGKAGGSVNLATTEVDLSYSLTSQAMTPYSGLTWQSIELLGHWRGTLKAPSADARLVAKQLQIPGGTHLGALNAKLSAQAGTLNVHALLAALDIPGPQPQLLESTPLTLDASVRMSEHNFPLELSLTHKLFTLRAQAVPVGDQHAQLQMSVPDVAPFAAVGGQKIKGDASLKAQVRRDSKHTHLDSDIIANIDSEAAWAGLVRGHEARLQLAGDLTDQQLTINRAQLSGKSISLSASASAQRTGKQSVTGRLDLKLADLADLSPALAGSMQLSGRVSGSAPLLSANAQISTSLSIHGSPRGSLTAAIRADGLPKAPRGTLQAQGDLDGAPLALDVAVEQADTNTVRTLIRHADWKSAHLEGELTGGAQLSEAHGELRLRMDRLADLDRLLETTLQGRVNGLLKVASGRAQVQLDARDVVTGNITTNSRLSADGTLEALNVKLAADSPAIGGEPVKVTSAAVVNVSAQQLRLNGLEAFYHGQTVRLLSPATISFAQGLAIEGLRLGAQDAVLALDGRLSPALDARASLRQVKPALVNAFVPNLLAAGTLQADAHVAGSFTAPNGEVHLDAKGLKAANDATRGLPATDIHASAQLMGSSALLDTKLNAGSASHLALSGRAPLGAAGALDLKLTGDVDVALVNPLLEAGGRHATGTLNIATTVTGAAASPEIGGTVRLSKASLRDYTQGTNLTDINGVLTGSHGTLHIEKLTARAAPGEVSVEGTIGVLQPKIPVDLKLTATKAQPIANTIITANLNADIEVKGTAREKLDVTGKVHINRADVEVPSGFPPNVAVLDVRRPGQAAPQPVAKPLTIAINVTVDAPRQILVKGRGLDAELGGEIRVHGTSDSPLVSGSFELQRGFFTLASSKLTFSSGTVTFNGAGLKNKIDPTLDFTAQSQVLDVTATVKITGLADAPKIELSSTPELPQDEILARLLFGVPAAQLTALQVVQIGAALASLSGGGGGSSLNPVAKVQKALGLDRLSVSGGSSSNSGGATGTPQQNTGPTIEAGRYVSSRVFVAVKESTTGQSQLAVDVDLTKHLKLQTRIGNGTASAQGTTPENDPGSSLGVAYQFEY